MSAVAEQHRTRQGGYYVPVDSLEVGDRLEGEGNPPRHLTITAIAEKPKTRRVCLTYGGYARWTLLRRTTEVARAAREGEAA